MRPLAAEGCFFRKISIFCTRVSRFLCCVVTGRFCPNHESWDTTARSSQLLNSFSPVRVEMHPICIYMHVTTPYTAHSKAATGSHQPVVPRGHNPQGLRKAGTAAEPLSHALSPTTFKPT